MEKNLFIGIDVSKLTLDATALFPDNGHCHSQFKNTKAGFGQLARWAAKLCPGPDHGLILGFEDTGVYSVGLGRFLSEKGLRFVSENAYRIRRSMGIVRGKDDQADPLMIARYLKRNLDELTFGQAAPCLLLELGQLSSQRERLLKEKSAHKTRIKELKVLEGCLDMRFLLKVEKEMVALLDKKLKEVQAEINRRIAERQELREKKELLCTVPGVGEQTANQMLVLTRGFTRFPCWRKFSCYAGLAPFRYSSGTSVKGRTKVSKIANKKIKALLTMGALTSIKAGNEYRKYYERKTAEGKHPMAVLNAIKNKIVSRMFAVIQRNTPYVCLQV
ncbi:IS110 family transposase [Rufibacter sp. XAAS-G3-1]|uniref:IS110 family transposase n=1 Tax=Rufibacter sp. XAAS-G3-1 TaxID=2729134 RepID=UPI0015E63ED1|nr:IS110 family transposase [Rufibacter sp. XAAS-G3-1]